MNFSAILFVFSQRSRWCVVGGVERRTFQPLCGNSCCEGSTYTPKFKHKWLPKALPHSIPMTPQSWLQAAFAKALAQTGSLFSRQTGGGCEEHCTGATMFEAREAAKAAQETVARSGTISVPVSHKANQHCWFGTPFRTSNVMAIMIEEADTDLWRSTLTTFSERSKVWIERGESGRSDPPRSSWRHQVLSIPSASDDASLVQGRSLRIVEQSFPHSRVRNRCAELVDECDQIPATTLPQGLCATRMTHHNKRRPRPEFQLRTVFIST